MSRFSPALKIAAVGLWLCTVYLAAAMVDNWRISKNYADLLPPSAQQVLAAQNELKIDVFAMPGSAAADLVGNFLKPLTNQLKAVEVNYLDSSLNLELVKLYGIQKQGEMVVHSGEQNFQLSTLSYEAFFNGLKRLNQPHNRWVVFLENLSSHSFSDANGLLSNNSYSNWLQQLLAANYQATVLSWQPQLALPQQAQLIVLAAPAVTLSNQQMQWLESQIALGRSVLWLTDPAFAGQQPALSLLFDVLRTDAFHQGQLVVKNYPDHFINQNFDRPLDLFEAMPFETANQPLWLNQQNQVLAATQQITGGDDNQAETRLMVVGDSDFLTNQYLNSGGNLEMSYRIIDWLLLHDDRIDLPSIGLDQTQLHFNAHEILWFAGIMLILMPLLLFITAGYWWRKNK